MFYLVLQTWILLAACAVLFFGFGWFVQQRFGMSKREEADPWRPPDIPHPDAKEAQNALPPPVAVPARHAEDADLLEELSQQVATLTEKLSERDSDVSALNETIERQERDLDELSRSLAERDQQLLTAPAPESGVEEGASETVPLKEKLAILELEISSLGEVQRLREYELLTAKESAENLSQQMSILAQNNSDLERQLRESNQKNEVLLEKLSKPDNTEAMGKVLREQLMASEEKGRAVRAELESFQLAAAETQRDLQSEIDALKVVLEAQKLELQQWESQAAKTMPSPLPELPVMAVVEPDPQKEQLLSRIRDLEDELSDRSRSLVESDQNSDTELRKRLDHLEETLSNLKSESEMALLAQMEFQSKLQEADLTEKQRVEDLELELELRLSQLEREMNGIRQADSLIGNISEQVEERLKQQLDSLQTEITSIRDAFTTQEEEFKHRDQEIVGNLDKLQASLSKLGLKIEDEVPDSVLEEMDQLKGDILTSIPQTGTPPVQVSEADREIGTTRRRFEAASENLRKLLEQKDHTIHQLDAKIHELSRKLDPTLVGNDDLQLIKGIGPYIRKTLEKEFGLTTFKQIALIDGHLMEKISNKLFFKNKIQKEDWIGQAIALHLKKYDELLENPKAPYPYQWVG